MPGIAAPGVAETERLIAHAGAGHASAAAARRPVKASKAVSDGPKDRHRRVDSLAERVMFAP